MKKLREFITWMCCGCVASFGGWAMYLGLYRVPFDASSGTFGPSHFWIGLSIFAFGLTGLALITLVDLLDVK